MSPLRPLLLLSLALLAVLAPALQASATAAPAASASCGMSSCCCDTDAATDGPVLEPAPPCPCVTPTPPPSPAPSTPEARSEAAPGLPHALVDAPLRGSVDFTPAAAPLVREPPTPPPVRDVLGVRLL